MKNKHEFKQKNTKIKPSYAFRGSYDNTLTGGVEHKQDIDENRVIPGRAGKGWIIWRENDMIPIARKRMILDILRNQLELDNS